MTEVSVETCLVISKVLSFSLNFIITNEKQNRKQMVNCMRILPHFERISNSDCFIKLFAHVVVVKTALNKKDSNVVCVIFSFSPDTRPSQPIKSLMSYYVIPGIENSNQCDTYFERRPNIARPLKMPWHSPSIRVVSPCLCNPVPKPPLKRCWCSWSPASRYDRARISWIYTPTITLKR